MTQNTSGFKLIDKVYPEVLLREAIAQAKKGLSYNKIISYVARKYGTDDTDMYYRLKTFRSDIDRVIAETSEADNTKSLNRATRTNFYNLDSVISYLEKNKDSLIRSNEEEQELIKLEEEEARLKTILSEMDNLLEANRPLNHLEKEVEDLRVTYYTLERLGLLSDDDSGQLEV